MLKQEHRGMKVSTDKGFYITANSEEDMYIQLTSWCQEHPDKWVYIYQDPNVRPGKPIPLPEWSMEVAFYDKRPATMMMFWRLYQKGCEGLEEGVTNEIRQKQLNFFAMLGGIYSQ